MILFILFNPHFTYPISLYPFLPFYPFYTPIYPLIHPTLSYIPNTQSTIPISISNTQKTHIKHQIHSNIPLDMIQSSFFSISTSSPFSSSIHILTLDWIKLLLFTSKRSYYSCKLINWLIILSLRANSLAS